MESDDDEVENFIHLFNHRKHFGAVDVQLSFEGKENGFQSGFWSPTLCFSFAVFRLRVLAISTSHFPIFSRC